MSPDLARQVQFAITRHANESAMHFCRLAQRDNVTFTNITYPTGLKMVCAEQGGEKAEVQLRIAKELRAAGYRVVGLAGRHSAELVA